MTDNQGNKLRGYPNLSLNIRIKASKEQVERGKVVEANDAFFQQKRGMILKLYFNDRQNTPIF